MAKREKKIYDVDDISYSKDSAILLLFKSKVLGTQTCSAAKQALG